MVVYRCGNVNEELCSVIVKEYIVRCGGGILK